MSDEPDRAMDAGRVHRGFFLRLGMSVGAIFEKNNYAAPLSTSDSVSGMAWRPEVLLGAAVGGGVIIGGGVTMLVVPEATFTKNVLHEKLTGYVTLPAAIAFTNFYFDKEGGFQGSLFGGVGELQNAIRGSYTIRDSGGFVSTNSLDSISTAVIFGAGFGWDAYVSRRWSIGLMANLFGYYASGNMSAMSWRNVSVTNTAVAPTLGAIATFN